MTPGILKQLGDSMAKALADATSEEQAAVSNYDALMAAKTKEVAALTQAIEEKTVRAGSVAVSIVEMKEDLSDTEAARLEDAKFLARGSRRKLWIPRDPLKKALQKG